MNLVSAVKDQLTGEVLGRMGSMLGESESTTAKAATGAVPALLAALAGSAATPGGADKMIPLLRQFDGGGLGNILGALKTGDAGAVQSQGSGILDSVLGGGALGGVADAVAKFSGVSPGIIKTMLTYLAPLILGTVSKHFAGAPVTPQGLTSFFADQKGNIDRAIPAGLSLPSLPGMPKVSAPRVTAPEAPGLPGWLLPLVGLALLGLAAWYFLGRTPEPAEKPEETAAPAPADRRMPPVEPVDKAAPPVEPVGSTTFLDDLKGVYANATETLNGIKDPATAEAAEPKLKEMNGTLDNLKPIYDKLPAAAKAAVAPVQSTNMSALKALVEKVLAIPGVADKIKPVLDDMVAKLSAFGG